MLVYPPLPPRKYRLLAPIILNLNSDMIMPHHMPRLLRPVCSLVERVLLCVTLSGFLISFSPTPTPAAGYEEFRGLLNESI